MEPELPRSTQGLEDSTDMQGASREVHLIATAGLAVVSNVLMLQLVGPWLLQYFFTERFARLPLSKQQHLKKLTISVMSSAVVGTTAVITHLFVEELDPAHIRRDVPAVRFNTAFMLGHTLTDTVAITLVRTSTQTNYVQLLLHHIVTLAACSIATFSISLPYYVNVALMLEVSTVFYCSGIIFREMNYPRLYLVIFFFFMVTFFSARIVIGVCISWYHLIPLLMTPEFYLLDVPSLIAIFGCFPAFQILNLVWFPMICQKLVHEIKAVYSPNLFTVGSTVRHSKNA